MTAGIYVGRERHIVPVGDWIEHEDADDCVCRPTMLGPCRNRAGDVKWTSVHHALDGRTPFLERIL